MKLYKVEFAAGGPPAYLRLEDDQVGDWRKDERVKKVSASSQEAADKASGITVDDSAEESEKG
jgi:hypothetical protein